MATILVAFSTQDEGFELIPVGHKIIRPLHGRDFTHEELMGLLPQADVLCTSFDYQAPSALLTHGRRLRLIANFGVGYNNIDATFAREHHIAVTNTPESVVVPTAELAFGLMLDVVRRISELDRLVRSLPGEKPAIGRTHYLAGLLQGKTLGLLGYGNIASALGKRAEAFGMHIHYHKRHRYTPEEEQARGITYTSFDELLRTSDILSVHTPYSEATHHLIDAQALSLMRPDAFLINTSRGAVIDEEALVKALQEGRLAGAGLDVYEYHDVPSPLLCSLPNVVLTPHTGTQTAETRRAMNYEMLTNVACFLRGEELPNRVV